MLRELRIENLLLIERAEMRLGEGLNAITGETGAGKTVLAHSLDLLMGGKARAQIVRPGAEEAWVEGVFDLPDGLIGEPEFAELAERLPEGADEVVLGRRVSAGGRTSAFVAGRAATAADLRLLGGRLLAFFGQHEHRKLTIASTQLEVLDGFAGAEHLQTRQGYREAHREHARLAAELAELLEREGSRERDLDLYRYELSEIEEVAPSPEELVELAARRERLRHAEGLRESAAGAHAGLAGAEEDGGGAAAALGQAESLLQGAAGLDPGLDEIAGRVAALAVEIGDVGSELRDYAEGIEADPGELLVVEERLEAIDRLERKHGGSVESVLEHAERCRAEIERLEGAEVRGAEAEAALAEAERRRVELGDEVSEGRAAAAKPLEERVAAELAQLAMEGARLEVVLEPHPDGFGPNGRETVELRVAPNPGIEPAPLREAASGGELSRVMLALSGLGEAHHRAGTLVFDEIDAGIGGNTARVVGERLRALGEGRQVLCITHLPQVASLATVHFRLEKGVAAGQSFATVERLDGEGVVEEIRRMLGGGSGDDVATKHARELIKAA
ncbi:MAG TPA: DNA repair protein RecN [Solirubrobacterales bacterium]|jgi:DNA repair protein RecN (Recombination protein N)|nr:DNA repair protein RecN [Solirubrobacterales bacterium]